MTSTSSLFESGIEAVHHRSALRQLRRAGRACLNPAALFVIVVVIGATFEGWLSGHGPNDQNLQARFAPPSREYFLGTDALGRDTFTRILYGARISLATAISAALLSTFLGAILGLLAGYLGGVIDSVVSYVSDVVMAFPAIIFALFILSVFGSDMKNVIIALAVYGVPGAFRVVRGQVLVIRELEYVKASVSVGASPLRTAVRHVLPNSIAPLTVAVPLAMSGAVLAEAGLSFLGLGVRPPTPTWGGMLADGYAFIYDHPRLPIIPGIAVFLLVLSLNAIGDQVRAALSHRRS